MVQRKYSTVQSDGKNGFKWHFKRRNIYVEIPEAFLLSKEKGDCFPIRKALYKLKQAAKSWYETLEKFLSNPGFKASDAASRLFFYEEEHFYLLWYVYDILVLEDSKTSLERFNIQLLHKFEIRIESNVRRFLEIVCKVRAEKNKSPLHYSLLLYSWPISIDQLSIFLTPRAHGTVLNTKCSQI